MAQGNWGSLLLLGCGIAYCIQAGNTSINPHQPVPYSSIFSAFKQNQITFHPRDYRNSQVKVEN